MKRFLTLYKKFPVSLFVCLFYTTTVFSAEIIEIPGTIEDNNLKIIKVLSMITDNSFSAPDKTRGFHYRYSDKWYSPFSFDLYVGRVNKNSQDTMIRIESQKRGVEKILRQIAEAELLKNPDNGGRRITSKSHILSQLFNVAQPAVSVFYNSYHSPVYQGNDRIKSMALYILADILLVGGAYYYTETQRDKKNFIDDMLNKKGETGNPFRGHNSGIMFGALAITRLIRITGSYSDTGMQNRLAEFTYSYKF
ncbi:MAG: hypothetical protein K8R21_00530 [Leptospira sp.]|nr:hypothetical protein [Leptospira sp.]